MFLEVPQWSNLGPISFNVFINDIFYFIQESYICNFAENNFKEVKIILKPNFQLLQAWFYEDHMVLNSSKCHYLIMNEGIAVESIELGKKTLHAQVEQKLLGIIIHMDLNFQSNTKSITKAAKQNLSSLITVAPLMTDFSKKVIFNFFIKSQVNYCPLLWMSRARAVNHKINRIHD